ncbi:MAG: transglycosylase domain-containing protein [Steroidobacteraceae bacterium]|jgi:membrane peptidoglycan carboxypeptidase|nr:transglycosylase domain-containing protein [Steroidobacteraceae bacterium]
MRARQGGGVGHLLLILLLILVVLVLVGSGLLAWIEITRSPLQAHYFSGLAREMTFQVEPGPSDAIHFPGEGPFDRRLGYTGLPALAERLSQRGYEISAQARISPRMMEAAGHGLFLPYPEKTQAGLTILDCAGRSLFEVRYPQRAYADFDAVPRVVVDSLLFIENRELLSNPHPTRNPAIEWGRLARAIADQLLARVDPDRPTPGASTLATQIEKYRHSPGGVTDSPEEKLRQMVSATLRAYLGGEDTTAVRRQLVVDYLNTVPLAARGGYGEVIGIGDGLWVWYGSDFDEVNRLLRDGSAPLPERALAYRKVLSLMISQRRPSGFLVRDLEALERLTDSHLRLLAQAGVITPALRDAALALVIEPRRGPMETARASFVDRKAATAMRNHLSGLLGVRRLYELDRLDFLASSTIDLALQERTAAKLREITSPEGAAAAGLMEARILLGSDPAGVTYSFTLYERTPEGNLVRVQTDNLDQPFDINEGARLDLGSTAKLRMLVTYLEIVAGLHGRLAGLDAAALRATPIASRDRLGQWAVEYLLEAQCEARGLAAMLEAALDRRYSASPAESFFTGGGVLRFQNFDPEDDRRVVTVREAMQRSINLPFVRLTRDIVSHTMFNLPSSSATLLDDDADPRRQAYLQRFAEQEGREYLRRFYRKYQGQPPEQADALLLRSVRATPRRLAAIFRYLEPEAGLASFADKLRANLPTARVDDASIARLYRDHAPERYDLADRGYIAGVHPLELWLVGYLRTRPEASLSQVFADSADERQDAYAWLFKTRRKGAQDRRIRMLVEKEAFEEIHRSWQRLGYPFESFAPSYATALGSSADRPAALAELVGILLNDGVRLPVLRSGDLRAAEGTPYETHFAARPPTGERVIPPEVAAAGLRALGLVVQGGTARRLDRVFTASDGTPLPVGGKTGTGDHRFETYGRGGVLLSSRVVSRSGTFVFYLGDRHFGTMTAYVKGPTAASYRFTSALPTQVLKSLAPILQEELNRAPRIGTSCAVDAPLRAVPGVALPVPLSDGELLPPGEALDTAPALPEAQPDAVDPDLP